MDRYDAFISYETDADGQVAAALQRGLQLLARPWNRRRALEVFRDVTGLSATPDLNGTLAKKLEHSEWLVWLASPESAASPWVQREIDHFIAIKPENRLRVQVAHTAGILTFEPDGALSEESTAVDRASWAKVFDREPLYIDLRFAREAAKAGRLDSAHPLRNPELKIGVAKLAAPIHTATSIARGGPTQEADDLVNEDTRQFKLAKRLRRAAIVALALLTASAVILSVVAVLSRAEAVRQRDRVAAAANHNLALALANASASLGPLDRERALVLAVEAHAREATAETTAAMFGALARESRVAGRFEPSQAVGDGEVSFYTLAANGSTAAVVRRDNALGGDQVTFIDVRKGMRVLGSVPAHTGARAAFTSDGRWAVVTSTRPGGASFVTGPSPDGTMGESSDDPFVIRIDLAAPPNADGTMPHTPEAKERPYLRPPVLSADGGFAVGGHQDGTVSVLDFNTGQRRQSIVRLGSPVRAVSISADSAVIVAAAGSTVTVFASDTLTPLHSVANILPLSATVSSLAFSPDRSRVGVTASATSPTGEVPSVAFVVDASNGQLQSTLWPFRTDASSDGDSIQFLPGGTIVAGNALQTVVVPAAADSQPLWVAGRVSGVDRSGTRLVTSGSNGQTVVRSAQTGAPLGLPFDIAAGELSPSAGSTRAAVFVSVDGGGEQIVTVGSRLTAWTDATGPPLLRALVPASTSLPMTDLETAVRAKLPKELGSTIELRAWSSDGRMIATLQQAPNETTAGYIESTRRLVVYSLDTDPPTAVQIGDPSPRGSNVVAAFSSDGATLFVADHSIVKAVDLRRNVGDSLVLFALTADISALASAADGSLAVATVAGDVQVLEPALLDALEVFAHVRTQEIPRPERFLGLEEPSHSSHVVGAWFDSTAKLLVTQDSSGVTHVVSVADRVLLVELHGATPGGRVAVSDRDLYVEGPQGIQQWRLDTDMFESLACASAGQRNLFADLEAFGIVEGPFRCR